MVTEKFEDLLNLNHITIEQNKINNQNQKLKSFEYDYFQEQLLTREQVLDYISDEDIKKYSIFGMPIKEFLDLAESDKYIPNEGEIADIGKGLYIIDRKNKTIHVYRYPSFDARVEDSIKTKKNGNFLEVEHTRSFLRKMLCFKVDEEIQSKIIYPDNIKLCEARYKEFFFIKEKNPHNINLYNILQSNHTMTRIYYFNITKNMFENVSNWET